MLGALCRISDKTFFVVGRGVSEDFRDVPRAIAIVDEQTVSLSLEFAMSAKQRFRCWPFEKGPLLGENGRTQKIVRSGVADVELDRGIVLDQLHQIRFEESPLLAWWLLLERFCTQLLHRAQRCDTEADFLCEAELQQSKKETTKTKMEFSQEIHVLHLQLKRSYCMHRG
jgi:hypothetical protein